MPKKELQLLRELRTVLQDGAKFKSPDVDAAPLRELCAATLSMLSEITEPLNRFDHRLKGARDSIELQDVRPGSKKQGLDDLFFDVDGQLRPLKSL
jgi:hypothetical protein